MGLPGGGGEATSVTPGGYGLVASQNDTPWFTMPATVCRLYDYSLIDPSPASPLLPVCLPRGLFSISAHKILLHPMTQTLLHSLSRHTFTCHCTYLLRRSSSSGHGSCRHLGCNVPLVGLTKPSHIPSPTSPRVKEGR